MHDESDCRIYIATLYGDINVMDCYVAIKDMMQHMINTQHIRHPKIPTLPKICILTTFIPMAETLHMD